MNICNTCQRTEKQITLYICDKCHDYVCEDCYKTSHSYDGKMGELLCPSCLKDMLENRNDHRDYIYSCMYSYIPPTR